jgi:hypothetical protein
MSILRLGIGDSKMSSMMVYCFKQCVIKIIFSAGKGDAILIAMQEELFKAWGQVGPHDGERAVACQFLIPWEDASLLVAAHMVLLWFLWNWQSNVVQIGVFLIFVFIAADDTVQRHVAPHLWSRSQTGRRLPKGLDTMSIFMVDLIHQNTTGHTSHTIHRQFILTLFPAVYSK